MRPFRPLHRSTLDASALARAGGAQTDNAPPPQSANITGTEGGETLTGTSGDDVIHGAGGNDHLRGLYGVDVLYGEAGDDTLTGGDFEDTGYGGDGDDVFADMGPADTFHGGDGVDTLVLSWQGNVSIDAVTGVGVYEGYSTLPFHFSSVEVFRGVTGGSLTFTGSSVGETVTGGAVSDDIQGFGGDDRLTGMGGGDVLRGGDGDDYLDGGSGDDQLTGGAGADVFTLLPGQTGVDTALDFVSGVDRVAMAYGQVYTLTQDGADLLVSIGSGWSLSTLRLKNTTDTGAILYVPDDNANVIDGTDDADTLFGLGGDDTIRGLGGDDALYGGWGRDLLEGGDGGDVLHGENGDDTLVGGEGDDALYGGVSADVLAGGAGNDLLDGETIDGGGSSDSIFNKDTVTFAAAANGVTVDLRIVGAQDTGEGLDTLVSIESLTGSAFADVLTGAEGGNVLRGGLGADVLSGLAGADVLYGGDLSADSLFGGDGDDLIDGGLEDVMDGGAGIDVAVVGVIGSPFFIDMARNAAGEAFSFGSGSFVNFEGLDATGGDGADRFIGVKVGGGKDTIVGGGGDDWFDGGSGDDRLEGDAGEDFLSGGDGNDRLEGGDGDDILVGGAGYDTYLGGAGVDTFYYVVGDGQDSFEYFGPEDILYISGASSATFQYYGAGMSGEVYQDWGVTVGGVELVFHNSYGRPEIVFTGAAMRVGDEGNNVLTGNAVTDEMQGRGGNDILSGGEGDDRIDGGAGNDTASYATATSGVTVSLNTPFRQAVGGGLGADMLLNIENLTGSAFADVLTGGYDANRLTGGGGNDTLSGGFGDDTLDGGAGDDLFLFAAGDGQDTIADFTAGGVDDRIQVTGFSSVTKVQQGANLLLLFDSHNSILLNNVLASDFTAADINVTIEDADQEGTSGDDVLDGTSDADVMYGRAGNDVLNGLGGTDFLFGEDGADQLSGGEADDFLTGGAGNDVFAFSPGDGADTVLDFTAGGGEDSLLVSGFEAYWLTQEGDDLRVILDAQNSILLRNVTIAQLTAADINIPFRGLIVTGDATGETIQGSAGDDQLDGQGGADQLSGLAGDDVLKGGAGDDVLTGGAGDDRLEGGAGIDTYVVALGDGHDTIIDSPAEASTIRLSGYGDVRMEQDGANVRIVGDADNSVTLVGRQMSALPDIIMDGYYVSVGGTGADVMSGDARDNMLLGHEGNDTLGGLAGKDWLLGGAGDDVLVGGSGGDIFDGGEGFDTADFRTSVAVTINVTGGPNYGGAGGDSFVSVERYLLSGYNDRFNGSVLGETIDGGTGDDELAGGEGNDRLIGGAGADHLDGGGGIDTVDYSSATSGVTVRLGWVAPQATNGAGTDTLWSIEHLIGSAFADTLTGSGAPDLLEGGAGADTLSASAGVDTLVGGLGDDTLDGGGGNDLFLFAAGDGHDVINGFVAGGTEDRIEVTGFSSVETIQEGANLRLVFDANNSILLMNVLAQNFTAADINVSFYGDADPFTHGTGGNDIMTGTAGADLFDGSGGNDIINGLAGDDDLRGGEGNDALRGGLGADLIDGGAGTDTVNLANVTTGLRINLTTNVHVGAEVAGDSFSSIETWLLGSAADNFTGSVLGERVDGRNGNDVLNGLGGDDTLNGGDGDDTLNAGEGDDRATGGNGADRIDGGVGADVLTGSAGDDYLHGRDGDDILDGGAGADTLIGGYGVDVANYRLSAGAVHIDLDSGIHGGDAAGDSFNSIEYFVLSNHDDTIVGSWASDIIRGMAGNDVMSGGDRHDGLNGGDGADVLDGGTGRDTLQGEKGDDLMTGGADTDWFWIAGTGTGADVVTDFENGLDKVRITNVAGVGSFTDLAISGDGSGWAVITFPDGSTLTLEGVTTTEVDAGDFLWV